ncbi:MAG TPA: DUF1566 domain-containing protein [Polyangia bacterium]|jgi:hypothetical protein|nr:DUF1566 domain-containing protein [Polyangia bacterium]
MPNGPSEVGAGAPNPETYTDNGDSTVTDTVTGLMWQKAVAARTFPPAPGGGVLSNADARHPQRLAPPTIIELTSIVDLAQSNPSINVTSFPATPAAAFWSSSLVAGSPAYAWSVSFNLGSTSSSDMTTAGNVRCVR